MVVIKWSVPGDVILEVSGHSLSGVSHREAVDVLRSCSQLAHLTVQRGGGGLVVGSPSSSSSSSPASAGVVRLANSTQSGLYSVVNGGGVLFRPSTTLSEQEERHRNRRQCHENYADMGAVATAVKCNTVRNKNNANNGSNERVQNAILYSLRGTKSDSTWMLPNNYNPNYNCRHSKSSPSSSTPPDDDDSYKTTIRVSPRKASDPSVLHSRLPIHHEQGNLKNENGRRYSEDIRNQSLVNHASAASAAQVVVNSEARPDVIRLHVSFNDSQRVIPTGVNNRENRPTSPPVRAGANQCLQKCVPLTRQLSSSSSLSDDDCGSSVSPSRLAAVASPSISCSSDSKVSLRCISPNEGDVFFKSSSRCQTPLEEWKDEDSSSSSSSSAVEVPSNLAGDDSTIRLNGSSILRNCAHNDDATTFSEDSSGVGRSAKTRANVVVASEEVCEEKKDGLKLSSHSFAPSVGNDEGSKIEKLGGKGILERAQKLFPFITAENTFRVELTKNSRGLGLSVCGGDGKDTSLLSLDTTTSSTAASNADTSATSTTSHLYPLSMLIRVKRLYPLYPAMESGLLQIGDVLLAVNDLPLTGLSNFEAIESLRKAPTKVVLTVCRPQEPEILPPIQQNYNTSTSSLDTMRYTPISRYTGPSYTEFDVTLTKIGGSLGFTLDKVDDSHFIKALVKEPALSDGNLLPGDKIVLVSGTDISDMSHAEAVKFLRELPDEVTLCLWRLVAPPESPISPTTPFPDEVDRKKRPKPLLRKEALDMLSDKARHKQLQGSPSPSTTAALHQHPSPRFIRRCRAGLNSSATNISPPHDSATSSSSSSSSPAPIHMTDDDDEDEPPSSVPSVPSRDVAGEYSDDSEGCPRLSFVDSSGSSGADQPGFEGEARLALRTTQKPKRIRSAPVEVPSRSEKDSIAPSSAASSGIGSNGIGSSGGGTSNSFTSSSIGIGKHSFNKNRKPHRPQYLDLTSGGRLSPRKRMYGRPLQPSGPLLVQPSLQVQQQQLQQQLQQQQRLPPSASTLTEDSETSIEFKYLDSGDSLLDELTTVTSSEDYDSPIQLTLGLGTKSNTLLKWRGARLASQEDVSDDDTDDDEDRVDLPDNNVDNKTSCSSRITVELDRGWSSRLGFSVIAVETTEGPGIYIKVIYPGSIAAQDGRLRAGDKLVQINDSLVSGNTVEEVIGLLRKTTGKITLTVERGPDNLEKQLATTATMQQQQQQRLTDNVVVMNEEEEDDNTNEDNDEDVTSLNVKNNNFSSSRLTTTMTTMTTTTTTTTSGGGGDGTTNNNNVTARGGGRTTTGGRGGFRWETRPRLTGDENENYNGNHHENARVHM